MARLKNRFTCLHQPFFGRILLILCLIGGVFMLWMLLHPDTTKAKQCFGLDRHTFHPDPKIAYLEDVMESQRKPKLGKTVFFHETSCLKDGIVHLNARQACAIESAAKLNPHWDVFVLFASPAGFPNDSSILPPIISALKAYPNIHMRNINLSTYASDTPLADWLSSEKLFMSQYLNSHVSDFLRYLSLYKFGGTYMDLDVIVQKSLDDIEPNYAGAESENFVAAGVINFDYESVGRVMAELCAREFYESFDGADWGNNGPGVITRVLQKVCHTRRPVEMTREQCMGFQVYPPSGFYAVPWPKWSMFFEPNKLNKTLEMTKDSIVIHVWNKHSMKRKLKVGTKAAYGVVADKNCPKVYHSCGEYF